MFREGPGQNISQMADVATDENYSEALMTKVIKESPDGVGFADCMLNPAASPNLANSASVRSLPPRNTNIKRFMKVNVSEFP